MAKEPSGKSKPDQAESPPNHDKEREEIPSPEAIPETAEQVELPLEQSASTKPVLDPKPEETSELEPVDESTKGEPIEPTVTPSDDDLTGYAGEEGHDPHQNEFHDDHYGYNEEHQDEYHDDHYGYHEEHQDEDHDDLVTSGNSP